MQLHAQQGSPHIIYFSLVLAEKNCLPNDFFSMKWCLFPTKINNVLQVGTRLMDISVCFWKPACAWAPEAVFFVVGGHGPNVGPTKPKSSICFMIFV